MFDGEIDVGELVGSGSTVAGILKTGHARRTSSLPAKSVRIV
jgi:hypothetical protein